MRAFTIGLICTAFVVGGCSSADSADSADPASDSQDVVGVEDFAALEHELSLVKDQPDAHGAFKRPQAKLAAGPCYEQTLGMDPGKFQVRRYTNGAAFFHTLGGAPAQGDARPVVCMDLDIKGVDSQTVLLDKFEVDTMTRYHLGRESDSYAQDGTFLWAFQRGGFETDDLHVPAPGTKDTIDQPLFRGARLDNIYAGSIAGVNAIPPALVKIVFQFAWRAAQASDTFTLRNDPVGALVENDVSQPGDQHIRYQHLDAHRLIGNGYEVIAITPKGSDAAIAAHTLETCQRQIDAALNPKTKFQCTPY